MQHTVNRGDSLWRLAVRFQGSGTQWPKLVAHHNNEVARRGPHSGLLPIKDPNLIFIGQTLFLPPKAKRIEPGTGKKSEANCPAKNCDLAINYGIGIDTHTCRWSYEFPEAVIAAELTGNITIEMVSDNRHRHNLEIALSRDSVEVKAKLKKLYDPVLCKLLAEPSVKFEGGKLKLNSPIAAQANLGPYTIEVQPGATPMQMSFSIEPPKINATMKNDGFDYKYSADIKYKVDVTKLPKNEPVQEPVAETAKERAPLRQEEYLQNPTGYIDWNKLALDTEKLITIVSFSIMSFFVPQIRLSEACMGPIMPGTYYNHSVRPGYQTYIGYPYSGDSL